MTYTEYWKIVSPHFSAIRKATIKYNNSIVDAIMSGEKGDVYSTLEVFHLIDRFENEINFILNPIYDFANKLFLSKIHTINACRNKAYPRRPKVQNKPFLRLIKGGD